MRTARFSALRHPRARRGSVSAQTAIMLPVFIGTAALAIDVGFMFLAQAQARVASDSAVLAATSVFEENETEAVAEERAIAAAAEHQVGMSDHATITADDVIWANYEDGVLTPGVAFEDANAAVVDVAEPFDGFFSTFWGDFGLSGNSESRAIVTSGPAGAVVCFLPIALPHCEYPSEDADDVTENPEPYVINQGNGNTVAWALPTANPNPPDVVRQFFDFCGNTPTGLHTGDPVNIMNGVATPIVNAVARFINNSEDDNIALPWPTEEFPEMPGQDPPTGFGNRSEIGDDRWGYNLAGPIPLVDVGGVPGDCTGKGQLSGDPTIVGFTYGILYDARLGNQDQKGFMLQLDFVNDYDFGTEIDPDAIGNITADSPPQLIP